MSEYRVRNIKVSRALHLLRYMKAVAMEIGQANALKILENCITQMALEWCERNKEKLAPKEPLVDHAFRVYYFDHLGLSPKEVEIVEKTKRRVVCRWRNFCEVSEACEMLRLDTRIVCREVYEKPAKMLLKQIDSRLNFRRNYDKIRPYADFCEEIIEII